MTNTQGLRKNYLQIQGEVVFHLELHTRCTRKAQIIRAKHIVVCRKKYTQSHGECRAGCEISLKGRRYFFSIPDVFPVY